MLHHLLGVHQPPDRFHRDAPAAHELAPPDPVLPARGTEGVGRPLPVERRLRVHLSLLRHRRNQQARTEVPRARTVRKCDN